MYAGTPATVHNMYLYLRRIGRIFRKRDGVNLTQYTILLWFEGNRVTSVVMICASHRDPIHTRNTQAGADNFDGNR